MNFWKWCIFGHFFVFPLVSFTVFFGGFWLWIFSFEVVGVQFACLDVVWRNYEQKNTDRVAQKILRSSEASKKEWIFKIIRISGFFADFSAKMGFNLDLIFKLGVCSMFFYILVVFGGENKRAVACFECFWPYLHWYRRQGIILVR